MGLAYLSDVRSETRWGPLASGIARTKPSRRSMRRRCRKLQYHTSIKQQQKLKIILSRRVVVSFSRDADPCLTAPKNNNTAVASALDREKIGGGVSVMGESRRWIERVKWRWGNVLHHQRCNPRSYWRVHGDGGVEASSAGVEMRRILDGLGKKWGQRLIDWLPSLHWQ